MLALSCTVALVAGGIIFSVEAGSLKVAAVRIDAEQVKGGGVLQGTVELNTAAPEGGVVVPLKSSDAAVASVPESVLIPAGATSESFEISTSAVTAPTPVKITANYQGKRGARLLVLPEGTSLESVILSATAMEGNALQGVVTLSEPAPPGVVVVFLSSDDLSAVFPATVVIPEGETSATFTVERPGDVSGPMTISASYGDVTRSASVGEAQDEATITTAATGMQYYVAPNGSSRGNGTISSPWDLQTALNHPSAVKPGDTIWLRGGTYGTGGQTQFVSKLTGTASAPIIVRQYAGEHATVNGGIKADGAHTWFWGFEIINTSTVRDVSDINKGRPVGLSLYGNGNKAINLIIHNTGRAGIGFWSNVSSNYQGEIYGVIFWGNGIYDSGGTIRGDSIYANLADSGKTPRIIAETISFRNFNLGVKVYSEWKDRHVNGFQLTGNVSFDHRGYNIVVDNTLGGMSAFKAINNFTYQTRTESRNNLKFGTSGKNNHDAIVQDNYFVAGKIGLSAMYLNGFTNLVVTGNTVVSASSVTRWTPPTTTPSVVWNNNTYHGGSSSPFKYKTTSYNFDKWKSTTRFDANSTKSGYPTQARVFVRPNKYEPNRGHVIVYNWPRSATVSVDLSKVLKSGQAYEIRDAQNYFGAPVASGVYKGGSISLPMNQTAVAPIPGNRHITNVHTDSEFGVFVVIGK